MTSYGVLLVITLLWYGDCKATSTCDQKTAFSYLDTAVNMIANVKANIPAGSTSTCEEKMAVYYLDTAVGMIREAKSTLPSNISCEKNITHRPRDCSDLLELGYTTSGVYSIWPEGRVNDDQPLRVYCDMQTNGGGWTLIQKRGNFQRPVDYFYKDWKSYKEGFGDIDKDFWLGNDNIFALTNQKLYSVRFDLKDVENNTRYAEYSTFRIDDETHKYTLHVDNYTGDAGDSMNYHNNQPFSARDRDNDNNNSHSCAQLYKGAWWYNGCCFSNLNGMYFRGKRERDSSGVHWYSWKGYHESLETTEIKIRPKNIKFLHLYTNSPM